MNIIKRVLQHLFYNPYRFVRKNKHLITLGDSLLTKQFKISFHAQKGQAVTIGNGCILECSIIFEKDSGQVTIGHDTYIGGGTKLISIDGITIGNHVQISWDVTLYDHNGYSLDYRQRRKDYRTIFKHYHSADMLKEFHWKSVKSKAIVIEDDVWIGFGATILKGVTIGQGAIVAAHSVVTKDVEPLTIVMGSPAQQVKELQDVK